MREMGIQGGEEVVQLKALIRALWPMRISQDAQGKGLVASLSTPTTQQMRGHSPDRRTLQGDMRLSLDAWMSLGKI